MATSAWKFYNKFKQYMADGTINLGSDTFNLGLFTSASNAATDTLSTRSQVTGEVASANGYVLGGKALTGVTWATGASAKEMRFDATAAIWSASGGSISAAKFGVVYSVTSGASAGLQKLVCRSQLSTSQFSVTTGNTLTVTPSANGVFELN